MTKVLQCERSLADSHIFVLQRNGKNIHQAVGSSSKCGMNLLYTSIYLANNTKYLYIAVLHTYCAST